MMLPPAASSSSSPSHARSRAAADASAAEKASGSGPPATGLGSNQPAPRPPAQTSFTDDEIRLALQANEGNVLAAARQLGVHRNRVRRWLVRNKLEARNFGGETTLEGEPEEPRAHRVSDEDDM